MIAARLAAEIAAGRTAHLVAMRQASHAISAALTRPPPPPGLPRAATDEPGRPGHADRGKGRVMTRDPDLVCVNRSVATGREAAEPDAKEAAVLARAAAGGYAMVGPSARTWSVNTEHRHPGRAGRGRPSTAWFGT